MRLSTIFACQPFNFSCNVLMMEGRDLPRLSGFPKCQPLALLPLERGINHPGRDVSREVVFADFHGFLFECVPWPDFGFHDTTVNMLKSMKNPWRIRLARGGFSGLPPTHMLEMRGLCENGSTQELYLLRCGADGICKRKSPMVALCDHKSDVATCFGCEAMTRMGIS